MDPVSLTGLALSILPIVVHAVKAYKHVRSRLKIFSKYSPEVESIRKLFGVQRDCFLNETELILRLVLEDQVLIKAMMKAPGEHDMWEAPELEQKLEKRFERNFGSLKSTVENIGDEMVALENALICFTPLEKEHQKNDELKSKPFKDIIKSLRKRVKIAFEKEEFEKRIDRLERSNNNLHRLRKQVDELQKPMPSFVQHIEAESQCFKRRGQLSVKFGMFGAIRRASRGLHEALQMAWSSNPAPEYRHCVRLFLNAKADRDVEMKIIILCYESTLMQQVILPSRLASLEVHSMTLDSITFGNSLDLATSNLEHQNNGGIKVEQQKRRKVGFVGLDNGPIEVKQPTTSPTSGFEALTKGQSAADIQLSGHFCFKLMEASSNIRSICAKRCLGHLDSSSQEAFRHWLYPTPDTISTSLELNDVLVVEEVLKQPVHRQLTVVHQLALALQLATAVLKFNSTPWLNDLWTVKDLEFFRQGNDLVSSLQTMHFKAELSAGCGGSLSTNGMSEDESEQEAKEAHYRHGVRNLTLYSLGVALLSIGRWEHIDFNDVEAVRRLASQASYLGPKYQELTEKVLECDFGYGKDLQKPRLQEAVYESVILELEGMIAGLSF